MGGWPRGSRKRPARNAGDRSPHGARPARGARPWGFQMGVRAACAPARCSATAMMLHRGRSEGTPSSVRAQHGGRARWRGCLPPPGQHHGCRDRSPHGASVACLLMRGGFCRAHRARSAAKGSAQWGCFWEGAEGSAPIGRAPNGGRQKHPKISASVSYAPIGRVLPRRDPRNGGAFGRAPRAVRPSGARPMEADKSTPRSPLVSHTRPSGAGGRAVARFFSSISFIYM